MEKYSPEQVKQVLDELGLRVVQNNRGQYGVYCPFHPNSSSPAMTVSKTSGLWYCFNPACGSKGNLQQLVSRVTGRGYVESLRLIGLQETDNDVGGTISDMLDEMFESKTKFPMLPQYVVDIMVEQFWQYAEPLQYMLDRGFDHTTLRDFEIGLSLAEGDLIVYPVHTPDGQQCVGVVGRGFRDKIFRNSSNLPRRRVLFNLHRARKTSSTVIVTESGFDAMMVYQSGYPNVVSTMGSNVTDEQLDMLYRNFTTVIVFSDNDAAGHAMYDDIRKKVKRNVLRPMWDYDTLYPDTGRSSGIPKDACDLHESQIKHMIRKADNDSWI